MKKFAWVPFFLTLVIAQDNSLFFLNMQKEAVTISILKYIMEQEAILT